MTFELNDGCMRGVTLQVCCDLNLSPPQEKLLLIIAFHILYSAKINLLQSLLPLVHPQKQRGCHKSSIKRLVTSFAFQNYEFVPQYICKILLDLFPTIHNIIHSRSFKINGEGRGKILFFAFQNDISIDAIPELKLGVATTQ